MVFRDPCPPTSSITQECSFKVPVKHCDNNNGNERTRESAGPFAEKHFCNPAIEAHSV